MDYSELEGRVLAPQDPADLVPPPRFAGATFATWRVDPNVPGQGEAVAQVQAFAAAGRRRIWQLGRRKERQGLYLDGGFGVGKTHLLAATFHDAPGTRRYLSFAEVIGLSVRYGPEQAVDLLTADLVCIDEFELDDPSNTRLIDLILAGLIQRGTRVVTTSNTVPGELGQGRMFVDQFRAQLVRISSGFASVTVPGHDYRARFGEHDDGGLPSGWQPDLKPPKAGERDLVIQADELNALLARIPLISLRQLAGATDRVVILDLEPFVDQLDAIRFVTLVDRLYDWGVEMQVRSQATPDDLFLEEYKHLGYRKKYLRCRSRLQELCRLGGGLA